MKIMRHAKQGKMRLSSWWQHNKKINLRNIKISNNKNQKIKDLELELAQYEEMYRILRRLSTAQKRDLGLLDLFEERRDT